MFLFCILRQASGVAFLCRLKTLIKYEGLENPQAHPTSAILCSGLSSKLQARSILSRVIQPLSAMPRSARNRRVKWSEEQPTLAASVPTLRSGRDISTRMIFSTSATKGVEVLSCWAVSVFRPLSTETRKAVTSPEEKAR